MPDCHHPFAVALSENNYISSRTPAPCNLCFISSLPCLLFSLVGRRDDELLLKVPVAPLPWAGPNGAFVLFVSTHHLFFSAHRFSTFYHHILPPQTPPGLRLSERRSVAKEKREGDEWGANLAYSSALYFDACLTSVFWLTQYIYYISPSPPLIWPKIC